MPRRILVRLLFFFLLSGLFYISDTALQFRPAKAAVPERSSAPADIPDDKSDRDCEIFTGLIELRETENRRRGGPPLE